MHTSSQLRFCARIVSARGEQLVLRPERGGLVVGGDGLCIDFIVARMACRVFALARRVELDARGEHVHAELHHSSPAAHGWQDARLANLRTRVSQEFRVCAQQTGLNIKFFGHMDGPRCSALRRELQLRTRARSSDPLPVFIDATQLRTSPQGSLPEFRRALASLAERGPVMGVLLGANSVAMLQLMRLVRESEISNALVVADSPAQANAIWSSILGAEEPGPGSDQSASPSPDEHEQSGSFAKRARF